MKYSYFDQFEVSEHVRRKKQVKLSAWSRSFLAHSTLFILSTSDEDGSLSVSPRGGDPGFVRVASDQAIEFDDAPGNRLFESYRNINQRPSVGLLFVVPGINESLRMRGTAKLLVPPRALATDSHTPVAVLTVHITIGSWYYHCARAFKSGRLWDSARLEAMQADRPFPKRPPLTN